MTSTRRRTDINERFWAKVRKTDGCWEWTAGIQGGGYGSFRLDRRRRVVAHRFAYELLVGPIPEGLQLDHLCRNRICVNPAHLEPVTCRENLMRGETAPARRAAQTHCKRGHLFDEANTILETRNGRTWRRCRECHRMTTLRWWHANKGNGLHGQGDET